MRCLKGGLGGFGDGIESGDVYSFFPMIVPWKIHCSDIFTD